MSVDFQLAWPCPHTAVEETVLLGDDRRSLVTRQPVASEGTVRILVNHEVFIPRGGLFIPAQIFSSVSGPFDLIEGKADLTIATSNGSQTMVFEVTGTRRVTTDDLVQAMLEQQLTVATVSNDNGHLLFVDPYALGQGSYVNISGGAAYSLGFGAPGLDDRQRRARGQQLFPGWDLVLNPEEPGFRYPRFSGVVKANPLIKVTYNMPVERCSRCQGSYIENDYRFSASGHSIMVDNEDLLYQEALKILLTDVGSNPYHSWYGTPIRTRMGAKAIGAVSAIISEDVRRALDRMQSVQQSQSQFQGVTQREQLYSVLDVRVLPHRQSETTFLVDVTVQNAAHRPLNLSIVFSVPEVVSTLGSDGLILGQQTAGIDTSTVREISAGDTNQLTGGGS